MLDGSQPDQEQDQNKTADFLARYVSGIRSLQKERLPSGFDVATKGSEVYAPSFTN
jgi:hypothetical protein